MSSDQSPDRRTTPGARPRGARQQARPQQPRPQTPRPQTPRPQTRCSIYDVSPVRRAVALAGGQSALARRLGLRPQSVQQWVANGRIPVNRVVDVAEALNHEMTIEELRPDYFRGHAAGSGSGR